MLKNNLHQQIVDIWNETYATMKKYNSIPHRVGDITLYWGETHVLQYIGDYEGTTAAVIAKEFRFTPASCSEVIKKLRVRGLIERKKNAQNNREYFLYLTEEGRRFYELHSRFDEKKEAACGARLGKFSDEQMRTYLEIHQLMLQMMKDTILEGKRDYINLEQIDE